MIGLKAIKTIKRRYKLQSGKYVEVEKIEEKEFYHAPVVEEEIDFIREMEFPDIMAVVDPNSYMYYFLDEMNCFGKNIVHGDIAFAVIDMIFFDITEKMFGPHFPNKVVPKLVKEIDPFPIVHSILNDLIDEYLKE